MSDLPEGFEIQNDKLIYLPTGEDCTNFIKPGTAGTGYKFVWFNAMDRLALQVNFDKRRIPRLGWSGDIHAMAAHYQLDVEAVAKAHGNSVEAFDAFGVTIGISNEGGLVGPPPGGGKAQGNFFADMMRITMEELRRK